MSKNRKERKFPRITIDSIVDLGDSIVLIKRLNPPFEGQWAIPGGFIELGERVEDAVIRETKEETGLDVRIKNIFNVYSDPNRDPRGHTITLVYICDNIGNADKNLKANTDAEEVRIFKKEEIQNLKLAFDHSKILNDYLNNIK
ncbi:MAG: NUDIX domain-containing protein [Candidatus Lokiarchaeota archaeon]|nr:NUDIX domain-containing protein [Candidatus Lokiarchaeota archaeon]